MPVRDHISKISSIACESLSQGAPTNLAGDVIPVLFASALVDEDVLERRPHANDAVCHLLDLREPLAVELLVGHDGPGDSGTVHGRVRVQRADENLDLRVDLGLLLGRGGDNAECADSLAIEAHVLQVRVRRGLGRISLYERKSQGALTLANDCDKQMSTP